MKKGWGFLPTLNKSLIRFILTVSLSIWNEYLRYGFNGLQGLPDILLRSEPAGTQTDRAVGVGAQGLVGEGRALQAGAHVNVMVIG